MQQRYYIVVKANPSRSSVQVVDDQEKVIKQYYYNSGDEEELGKAFEQADKYIEELKGRS